MSSEAVIQEAWEAVNHERGLRQEAEAKLDLFVRIVLERGGLDLLPAEMLPPPEV